jgi:hypothetical protein
MTTDQAVQTLVRAITREVITEARALGLIEASATPEGSEQVGNGPLPNISPTSRVAYAEYVLKQEGGPLHVSVMRERMYALGYKHKYQPQNKDQLEASLNSLASPTQYPEKFKRVAPRTLALVNA